MSFAVGDRVIATQDIGSWENYGPIIPEQLTGTVLHVGGKDANSVIAVRWDLPAPDSHLHSCGGLCGYGYGYTVLARNITKLLEDDRSGEFDEAGFLRCVMCKRQ